MGTHNKSKSFFISTLSILLAGFCTILPADTIDFQKTAADFKEKNKAAFESGKFSALINELKKDGSELSAEDRVKLSVVYNALVEKSMARMRYEEAKSVLDESYSVYADSPETILLYGKYFLATGDWNQAVEWLLKTEHEKNPENALLLAKAYLLKKDHAQALSLYETLNNSDSHSTETQTLIDTFSKSNKIKLGTSYKAHGRNLLAENKTDEAVAAYEKGVKLLPATLKELNKDLLFFREAKVSETSEKVKTQIAALSKNKKTFMPVTIKSEPKKATGMLTAYSMDEAIDLAKKNDRKVLLILSATWCGPCKQLKKDTLHDPSVEKSLENYVMFIADVDQPEGKQLSSKYGTGSIPQSCIVETDGNMLERKGGYLAAAPYSQWLDSF